MSTKNKRIILVSVLVLICVVMLVLIIKVFSGGDAEVVDADVTATTETEAELIIDIPVITATEVTTTKKPANTEPVVTKDEAITELDETLPTDESESETVTKKEIQQNFSEAEKPAEPETPMLPDDVLENPDVKPSYEPEQTKITEATTAEPSNDAPYNGQKKDGKIYFEGFGWVIDEGGVAVGEYAEDMVENGNKIGYFG